MTEDSLLLKLERSLNLSLSENLPKERIAALFKELHDFAYPNGNFSYNNASDYMDYGSITESNITSPAGIGPEIVATCGNDQSDEFWRIWQDFVFWCEGVLLLIVGSVGCLGNILAICILSAEAKNWSSIHHLLIGLSIFDLIFLVFSMPVHAIPIPKMTWLNSLTSSMSFCFVYRFVLYPFCGVAYNVGVFITMSITIERFQAVCYPHHYREAILSTTPLKRALMYFIPAIIAALIFNIPKFLEVQIIKHNGTVMCMASELTVDETFVNWIKITYIINPFFSTTLIPILVLFVMNFCIYRHQGSNSVQVRRGQAQQSESRLQAVLIIICVTFVVTHFPRLILSILAFSKRSKATFCASHNMYYIPELPVVCMEAVSNLLIHINASFNFLIYSCTFSNFIHNWRQKVFLHFCDLQNSRNMSASEKQVGDQNKHNTVQPNSSSTAPKPGSPALYQSPQVHDALVHHEQGISMVEDNDAQVHRNLDYPRPCQYGSFSDFQDRMPSPISLSEHSRLQVESSEDATSTTALITPTARE